MSVPSLPAPTSLPPSAARPSAGARFRRAGASPGSLDGVLARLADTILEVAPGPWRPEPGAPALGTVVLDGLLVREIQLDTTHSAQLVVVGDVIDPFVEEPALGPVSCTSWRAMEPAVLGVLGRRYLAAAHRQPELTVAVHRRQAAQADRAARQLAIAHLPRVEQRILALLCWLAEDRGRVTASGVCVDLDVTHETLGRLIGAARPTVSLALKTLIGAGLLARHEATWTISHAALGPGNVGAAAA